MAELRQAGRWTDEGLVVTLRPLSAVPPPAGVPAEEAAEEAAAQAAPVRIGRVSVFYG